MTQKRNRVIDVPSGPRNPLPPITDEQQKKHHEWIEAERKKREAFLEKHWNAICNDENWLRRLKSKREWDGYLENYDIDHGHADFKRRRGI